MNDRSTLRIKDLKTRAPEPSRVMNIKVPAHVLSAIQQLAKQLGTTRTDVTIALLNEGLVVARQAPPCAFSSSAV